MRIAAQLFSVRISCGLCLILAERVSPRARVIICDGRASLFVLLDRSRRGTGTHQFTPTWDDPYICLEVRKSSGFYSFDIGSSSVISWNELDCGHCALDKLGWILRLAIDQPREDDHLEPAIIHE